MSILGDDNGGENALMPVLVTINPTIRPRCCNLPPCRSHNHSAATHNATSALDLRTADLPRILQGRVYFTHRSFRQTPAGSHFIDKAA